MNVYQKIFKALETADIQYLIVGGVAVNLYGYARFTGDIDILLMLDLKNLAKMEKIMNNLGYVSRLPVPIHELGDKAKLKSFIKHKGLKAYTFISSSHPQLDIDIIVQESTRFVSFYKKKSIIKVWSMSLPVISINDLISMKKKANRQKDILDIEKLIKLKDL